METNHGCGAGAFHPAGVVAGGGDHGGGDSGGFQWADVSCA